MQCSVGDKTLLLPKYILHNASTVFPYVENSAKYIAEKFAFRE